MDLEKLIENAKVCCGDIETEDCSERCINPNDKRGNEVRWCSQWLIHDLHIALSTIQIENQALRNAANGFKAENEKLRDEVERQRRSADDRQHLYENAERAYIKAQTELEQVKRDSLARGTRRAAVDETGNPL